MQKAVLNPVQSATCLELHSQWWCCAKQTMGNPNDEPLEPRKEGMSGTQWKQFHKSHAKWQSENILRRKQTSRACRRTSRNPLKDAKGSERKPEWKRWFYCRSLVYSMFSKLKFWKRKGVTKKWCLAKSKRSTKCLFFRSNSTFFFSRQAPRARRTTRQANRTFWSSATTKLRKLFFFWRLKRQREK